MGDYTYIVYVIGAITVIYASFSTIRTTDVKELIAYSSVAHASIYLMGAFSNTIQGIEGSIALGIAHGFVSSGLFICAGGVLYDRTSTRLIFYYRGLVQILPILSILFFILCLGNSGTPLTLTFGGSYTKYTEQNILDVNKREFLILFILVVFTVLLGIYPGLILDVLNYPVTTLIYNI